MSELGKRYGMGLQLINILRDVGSDLRKGRCYFPEEELNTVYMNGADILREPDRFRPIFRKWREKAEEALESGMQYSLAIRSRRLRAAPSRTEIYGTGSSRSIEVEGRKRKRRRP